MTKQKLITVDQLSEVDSVGANLFELLDPPCCVYLQGDLGTGKTTLCQSIVKAAGSHSVVTSPTYNLIHEYSVPDLTIYHMDLYRLEDPAEIEFLGIQDLWQSNSLFLIEWAERGLGYIPKPNFIVSIEPGDETNPESRRILIVENS